MLCFTVVKEIISGTLSIETGKGRGWGQNDVLTTCKAVPLRGGQRIIAVTFPIFFLKYLRSENRTGRGNNLKKSCLFVFLAYRPLVLKLPGELKRN